MKVYNPSLNIEYDVLLTHQHYRVTMFDVDSSTFRRE